MVSRTFAAVIGLSNTLFAPFECRPSSSFFVGKRAAQSSECEGAPCFAIQSVPSFSKKQKVELTLPDKNANFMRAQSQNGAQKDTKINHRSVNQEASGRPLSRICERARFPD